MISAKTLKTIEYDKIMANVATFAVLEPAKEEILSSCPVSDLSEAEFLLKKTNEAYNLLYKYNVSGIYFFPNVYSELERADKGGVLNIAEILRVTQNLKSARIMKTAFNSVHDDSIKILPEIGSRLFINQEFEKEISSKIISEEELSDNASPKLYSLRKSIRNLNAKIRDTLNSFMRGAMSKYLQECVVTLRHDRYVVPVKSEYRSTIKGFIHDQSSSGSTIFIEPESVMELNNELKHALLDEINEINRILAELTAKITTMSDAIRYNTENLTELDVCFAKAIYSFNNKCTLPKLNSNGIIKLSRARHPLIDKNRVVPITISLGEKYRFLLITGPNTGGKTVTMKLTGLLSLMAMSGLFIPADDESEVSVFDGVYCDIGDEQSIEQSLSTFSSHITNILNILNNVSQNSLVLIDEIGAGTDPEEGCALALAIIEKLVALNCAGIITTHYSKLKEYAVDSKVIENASMEFDAVTLKPVYKLNIGIPGSSNAIEIAKTLGMDKGIINTALGYLSDNQIGFEKVLKKAEESRREADALTKELNEIKLERQSELDAIKLEKEKIAKEREKIYSTAKQETKRIVADKLSEAEEIIDELKKILKQAGLESREVFRASELKNRLKNSKYLTAEDDNKPFELKNAKLNELKVGDKVYIKSLNTYGKVLFLKPNKKEAEISIGNAKMLVKLSDIFNNEHESRVEEKVIVNKRGAGGNPQTEINVLGKTSLEALEEVKFFIDQAIVNGLEEIKIIHGVGSGILLKEIREYLKHEKSIVEYRRGKYGEGENGVTIVRLK